MIKTNSRRIHLLAVFLCFSCTCRASDFLDNIRNTDLNDYALGLTLSVSENPYSGADNSTILYPYLTSLRNPEFTDDWFLINEGNIGIRNVTESGLVVGALARVQTLGFGSTRARELIGLDERNWSWELAPMIGWRGRFLHFDARAYKEVFNRHGGLTTEIEMSLPIEWDRGHIVPSIGLNHYNNAFMDYYYGVAPTETTATRLTYDPSAATSIEASLAWGYRISDVWLLSGSAKMEFLPDEIRKSPIVENEATWSFSMALAYNANIFVSPAGLDDEKFISGVEVRLGVFSNSSKTRIVKNNSEGEGGYQLNLEDVFGAPEKNILSHTDLIIRIGRFHRLQLSHFNLGRSSEVLLDEDLEIGDSLLTSGTSVLSNTDTSVTSLSYGYSLIKDAQKDVGILAGVHQTKISAEIISQESGELELVGAEWPLPILGAFGIFNITDKTSLNAQAEFFRLQFDGNEGYLNQLNVSLEHQLLQNLSIGLGYKYQDIELNSSAVSVNGQIKAEHRGPSLYFAFNF